MPMPSGQGPHHLPFYHTIAKSTPARSEFAQIAATIQDELDHGHEFARFLGYAEGTLGSVEVVISGGSPARSLLIYSILAGEPLMLGATLALAVIVHGAPGLIDPSALVVQLGSPRFELRESADLELSRLGRMALPALRAARDSRDPEIRIRVTALLTRIEGSLLVQATPIGFDFRDVPIRQAIRTINGQAGLNLLLAPEAIPIVGERRLNLRTAGPLPFWKAIDALCEAGQLHYSQAVASSFGQTEGAFPLHDGSSPSGERRVDHGPFRIQLIHARSLEVAEPREPRPGRLVPRAPARVAADSQPVPSGQFPLHLMVLAEPRLSITLNGAIKLTAAVDDHGQSLVPRLERGTFQHTAGYFGMNPAPMVRLPLYLAHPEKQRAGSQIRLIKGVIPVIVTTRKVDPLEIRLADSLGKSRQNKDATITLRAFRLAQNAQPSTIELSIRSEGPGNPPIDTGDGEPLAYRPDSPQKQVEVLDDQGRVLPWFQSGTFYNGEETRLLMTMTARGVPSVPATIRYYGIIRAATEIPFEFRDVPMP
jgi:hypothetical protein